MSLTAQIFGRDSLIFKGANLGTLGLAGYLDRQMNPGADPSVQRLGDISQQTAKEGEPRTIVWGRVRPIGGNIIHCQTPVKRWVVTSTSSGGKGGGKKKQEQRTEHVYRTYAIGVCEGPITAFSRIWRNNKLVYDGRGTSWGARNNGVFLKSFRLYLGGWSQMPDPTLQSIWGAGKVPAYRGTAYMVALDEDLTDQGGMVPQWLFEVERAEGSYLTSKPYAVECIESAQAGLYGARIPEYVDPDEVQAAPYSVVGAVLREPLITHDCDPEEIEAGQYYATSATLRQPLIHYKDGLPESVDAGQYVASSAILRSGIVKYENYPAESIDAGQYTVTGATLT